MLSPLQLEGNNKLSLMVALKELKDAGILQKNVIRFRPLHIECQLTEKGRALTPIFLSLENVV